MEEDVQLTCGWRSFFPVPLGLGLSLSVIISLRVDGGHWRGTFPSSVGLTQVRWLGFSAVSFALFLLPCRFKWRECVNHQHLESRNSSQHRCQECDLYLPILGDGVASWRVSLPAPGVLMAPIPPWCSSCLSSKLPIKALRMMSSNPRLLAGSLKEWFLGFMLPINQNTAKYTVRNEYSVRGSIKHVSEFPCYLLELVTAGKLKISVPGCALPARQLLVAVKLTRKTW